MTTAEGVTDYRGVQRINLTTGAIALVTDAPRGFVYCEVCKCFEHPEWHDITWRDAMLDVRNYDVLLKFILGPKRKYGDKL